jgi:predicted dehydrogenase
MASRLRVGVLGLSHDHVWGNLAAIATGGLGRVVAAAEPSPRLRERFARDHGSADLYPRYHALLDRRDLDAVIVFADNRASAALGVQALASGLPVMVEKPMAADLAGAEALLAASRTARLPLMVNWPSAWRPALRLGLELGRAGRIGEPVQLSHRGGHAGPREFGCSPEFSAWLYDPERSGGGALVDYCGYGAVLARVLLGHPSVVTAVSARLRKPDLPAEDSAVVVLHYPRALALLEASWTQIGGQPAFGMIIYGDTGTLIVHQPRATRDGQVVGPGRIEIVSATGSEVIEPPPLPAAERDGPTYFLTCLRTGRPVEGLCAADVGRDVQEVLEAGIRASATGCAVTLPLQRPSLTST